jgi:hypothetical protein
MSESYPWEHMLERARTNGLLGKQLFVVNTTPVDGMAPIQANIKEHLAYQRMLEDTGVMFAAGPVADDGGAAWSGEGMVWSVRTLSLRPKPSRPPTRCTPPARAAIACARGSSTKARSR